MNMICVTLIFITLF